MLLDFVGYFKDVSDDLGRAEDSNDPRILSLVVQKMTRLIEAAEDYKARLMGVRIAMNKEEKRIQEAAYQKRLAEHVPTWRERAAAR